MNPSLLLPIARRLMRLPAAPFHESVVQTEVESICREHGLTFRRDRYGNLLIELKRGRMPRPLVLVAHMDHPAFDVTGTFPNGHIRARFLGGVPARYFRAGTRVRLLPDRSPGRLGPSLGQGGRLEFEIIPDQPFRRRPAFAVWELEDFALRDGLIYGRACDDLMGVAAILATLIAAADAALPIWVIGAITRAEEIGFGGALALAETRAIPRRALVVSLETSRELPPVNMGDGVIIRVGDRSTVFDSRGTRFLTELANDLQARGDRFKFQRALMAGGSCEGTVFSEAGFQTVAVCVALGNYHNCGPRGRIAAEFVSRADGESMVTLLVSAAARFDEFDELAGRLGERLDRLAVASRTRLLRSARAHGSASPLQRGNAAARR